MKLPIFKRTFEFYKRLGQRFGFGKIAQISGVTTDTADDWGRPPESDDYPFGTGKRNTSDTVLRQIRLAYQFDPGFARAWALMFPEYVDHLDTLAGADTIVKNKPLCTLIAESAKEHLDIVVEYMTADEIDYEKLLLEIGQSRSKLVELEACVQNKISEETRGVAEAAFNNPLYAGRNGR